MRPASSSGVLDAELHPEQHLAQQRHGFQEVRGLEQLPLPWSPRELAPGPEDFEQRGCLKRHPGDSVSYTHLTLPTIYSV